MRINDPKFILLALFLLDPSYFCQFPLLFISFTNFLLIFAVCVSFFCFCLCLFSFRYFGFYGFCSFLELSAHCFAEFRYSECMNFVVCSVDFLWLLFYNITIGKSQCEFFFDGFVSALAWSVCMSNENTTHFMKKDTLYRRCDKLCTVHFKFFYALAFVIACRKYQTNLIQIETHSTKQTIINTIILLYKTNIISLISKTVIQCDRIRYFSV